MKAENLRLIVDGQILDRKVTNEIHRLLSVLFDEDRDMISCAIDSTVGNEVPDLVIGVSEVFEPKVR